MIYALLGIILVLILVILVRTILFVPKNKPERTVDEVDFDSDKAIENLAKLVKCKTVSNYDHSLENDKEFNKLIKLLPKLYPNVHKKLKLKKFEDRGLLYYWKGKNHNNPAVFMAHYDVVPVEEENWTKPAFEALIEDGIMWGRGTLDTKVTFNGILFSAEHLLKKGFVPENDIYFAFSGGEEVTGPGAKHIVDYFKENNITPAFVLDEGGAVVEGIFPGLNQPCGLVGIAEKGFINMSLSVKSSGGHASAPSPHTPIGVLSKAVCDIENHPFKVQYTAPVLKMFDELGRRSTFLYRMIFANLWAFGWILDIICKKSGGQLNALVRTTCAFTKAQGSEAANVIPPSASVTANMRLSPNDSIADAIAYIKKVVNNDDINITTADEDEPSRISVTDCKGYELISNAIEDTWKGCVCAPYLMVQCSDSRHYGAISDRVYRFSAYDLTSEELESIHGNDEHIRLESIKHSVEFFIRVMKDC